MDPIYSRESDDLVDLENGETSREDGGKHSNISLGRLRSGHLTFDGFKRGGDGSSSSDYSENLEMLEDEVEKKAVCSVGKLTKDKWKKGSSKKPSKPPLPPVGSSLDASDMLLVREISELTKIRHAKIERLKLLKKMRGDKSSSSSVSLFALIVTILFCVIILSQGIISLLNIIISELG
ncbi:putative Transmembrane protein [Quillaja saponaria]|uniref:Transmembrane protein n=1 Tax=Quillaja saponaria TaxID=32244 RepID=A0AAD7QAD8_QUISA|nr:putative Transmembrane protein [Quillaja saponaria]